MDTTRLDELAKRLHELAEDVPDDGRERAMTVMVGRDNSGNITFGNQITINLVTQSQPTQPQPEESLQEQVGSYTQAELDVVTKVAKRQRRDGLIRSYLNIPFTLMALIAGTIIAALLSGHLWQLVTGDSPWLVPAAVAVTFLPVSYWAARLKRREEPLIREARETLKYVRQMQHRRRVWARQ